MFSFFIVFIFELVALIIGNDWAMISVGLKGTALSIKHLAETFYFDLSFRF